MPRALGAGGVSGSGSKHLALQLREEIGEAERWGQRIRKDSDANSHG